jgi:hypothetical protein
MTRLNLLLSTAVVVGMAVTVANATPPKADQIDPKAQAATSDKIDPNTAPNEKEGSEEEEGEEDGD